MITLDIGTIVATSIALAGSVLVMVLFWRQNIKLEKKIRVLQIALRDERKKNR
jgi:hypothetical protein